MAVSLHKPICFVLTPFGKKLHPDTGASIDFDAIYEQAVRPALHAAGMDPVRLDQELAGSTESSARERVMEAEFAVADVTTREPAILFLLGARAERMPGATLILAAPGSETQLANLSGIRVVIYELDEGNWLSSRELLRLRKALTTALTEMRSAILPAAAGSEASLLDRIGSTSPLLGAGVGIRQSVTVAQAIEAARGKRDTAELKRLEADLVRQDPKSPLLLNIFAAYGNLGEWEAMVGLFERLPAEMRKLPRVRQQAGLALNLLGRADEAVKMLSGLLKEQGPDSETFGLLGSVYKGQWVESKDPAALDRAIQWYMKGFEANRKDAYPGINAVTLLDCRGDAESQRTKERLLPLVMAAVQDQIKYARRPNYWDHATLLELAVLGGDEKQARLSLAAALRSNPESWQTEATADNLNLIREARAQRGELQPWLDQIRSELHPVPA
jgi:tetratricopeptide (TPR) repeat protein